VGQPSIDEELRTAMRAVSEQVRLDKSMAVRYFSK